MAEKKVKTTEVAPKKEKAKTGMPYSEMLKARAQRGVKTHQKELAIAKVKQKEMEGK